MTVNWCHFCSGFQALSVIRYILCRIHLILQTCHLCYIKYNPGEKAESPSILASLEIKCLAKSLPIFIFFSFEKVENQIADTILGTAESVGMLLNYVLESSELGDVD